MRRAQYAQKRGTAQRDFAQALGVSPPEVSRWLTGLHDLTLKTIVRMEAALGEDILFVKKQASGGYLPAPEKMPLVLNEPTASYGQPAKAAADIVAPEARFLEKSAAIAVRVAELLKTAGKSQKDLAAMLEKSPSEVSKWMSGEHNFSLRTIAKIEVVLGEEVVWVREEETA